MNSWYYLSQIKNSGICKENHGLAVFILDADGTCPACKAAQPLRAADAASALPAEQNSRSNIVPAVESDTQPRP